MTYQRTVLVGFLLLTLYAITKLPLSPLGDRINENIRTYRERRNITKELKMTAEPRIFIHKGIPMLVHVVWDEGKIVNLSGPVATQGSKGMDITQFRDTVVEIMGKACSLPPLNISNLPEKLRKEIKAADAKEEGGE